MGTRVRVEGCGTPFLNGLVGTVASIKSQSVSVDFGHPYGKKMIDPNHITVMQAPPAPPQRAGAAPLSIEAAPDPFDPAAGKLVLHNPTDVINPKKRSKREVLTTKEAMAMAEFEDGGDTRTLCGNDLRNPWEAPGAEERKVKRLIGSATDRQEAQQCNLLQQLIAAGEKSHAPLGKPGYDHKVSGPHGLLKPKTEGVESLFGNPVGGTAPAGEAVKEEEVVPGEAPDDDLGPHEGMEVRALVEMPLDAGVVVEAGTIGVITTVFDEDDEEHPGMLCAVEFEGAPYPIDVQMEEIVPVKKEEAPPAPGDVPPPPQDTAPPPAPPAPQDAQEVPMEEVQEKCDPFGM